MGTCHWLRFYDLEGNLFPLPEEAERERANQSEQRFEDLLTRLRQRGIDPETL